jgi:hypothetical protein
MAKIKHHYVPQFYLRNFASSPKRINLYNLRTEFSFPDAGIKDQCYRPKLYGETDQVEDFLSKIEADASPILTSIVESNSLPDYDSDEYIVLMMFIALQMQRTVRAGERMNASLDGMVKQVMQEAPSLSQVAPDDYTIGYDNPSLISLQIAREIAYCLDDLHYHIIHLPKERRFFTSDNPIFSYNQYCEGLQGMGVTAALSRGLQLFFPISPHVLLMLYDSNIYKPAREEVHVTTRLTHGELVQINTMQAISADEHVYFSNWRDLEAVKAVARRARRHREQSGPRTQALDEEGGDKSVLVHTYDHMPNLQLGLSFMSIREKARTVPLTQRTRPFRKEVPDFPGTRRHYRPPIKQGTVFKRRDKK